MGDGIVLPADKLTSTAEVLKALSTSASQIADGLSKADPPDALWGALGLLIKGTYDEKAEQTRRHVRTIAEALNTQGGAIHETVRRYEEVDAALEAAFKRFQDRLAGGGPQ